MVSAVDRTHAPKRADVPPTHPGEILGEDVLPALRLTRTQAAEYLGVSRATLQAVIAGQARMSDDMQVRLGKLAGNGAEIWSRLQGAWDLWHAKQRNAEMLGRIPTLQPTPGHELPSEIGLAGTSTAGDAPRPRRRARATPEPA